jgi:DNA-binding transcriptional LysR family regulator
VVDERLVLGVAPDHPLAGRRSVTFTAALTHPLITMPPGTGARTAFESGCHELRADPPIAFECSSPELIGSLAARGLGAVLPEPLAAAVGLVAVPLVRPSVRSRISLIWRRGGPTTPAARAFLAVMGSGSSTSGGGTRHRRRGGR